MSPRPHPKPRPKVAPRDVFEMDTRDVSRLDPVSFRSALGMLLTLSEQDRKRNQLHYYKPGNVRAIDIHTATERVVGVGGGNGCLALSAPVLMADGTWRPLGEIRVGDFVMAANPETGITHTSRVTRTYRSGVRAIYRTTFSDGGTFEATLDHKVPLYLGSGRTTSKGNPKRPRKRVLRDYYEPINRRGSRNPSKRIAAVSPEYVFPHRRRVCRTIEFVRYDNCGDIEVDDESHCYITGDYVIVSNSSKTETCLAEMCIRATGIVPDSLKDVYPREKLRGPIQCRVVCESLTNVLHNIILRKLQPWQWTGIDPPGGKRGHWGWIPESHLISGSWEKSWSEKYRTLRVLYKNPDTGRVEGESSIQFMSRDQDASDFASGDFHFVLHDEPPTFAIWRENQARTMRVKGTMMLAMTWPDDPSIPVDWIFDEVYDPGRAGPNKNPDYTWINLYTTDNPNLDQDAVASQASSWSDEVKRVRIYGEPIRFSNRIHPLFTEQERWWCFRCKDTTIPHKGRCACGSDDLERFCHVQAFEPDPMLPTVCLLDPHPRKPHCIAWFQIDPFDDYQQVAEAEVDGNPADIRECCDRMEMALKLNVAQRLMDPNMGRSPSRATQRTVTWQDEMDEVGLRFDLADDSDVGRTRVNEFLRVDPKTRRPRLRFRETCKQTRYQMQRYIWDEHRASLEKDVKQKPRAKYDDFPTLLKYFMNADYSFRMLKGGQPVIRGWYRG